jgi:hypothetical protein
MKYSFNLKKSDKSLYIKEKMIKNILNLIFLSVFSFLLFLSAIKITHVISLHLKVRKSVGELKIPTKKEINRFNKKISNINDLFHKIDFSFSQLFSDLEEYLIKGILIRRIELSLHKFKQGPILPGGKIIGFASNMAKAVELVHKLSSSKKFYDVLLTNVKNEKGKTTFEMVFHYEK